MNKLLFANFSLLFRSILFWLGMICSAGLAIFVATVRYIDMKQFPDVYEQMSSAKYNLCDEGIFCCVFFLIFAIAVVVSLFIGTEYSDGTIRNKIIAGHQKMEIYLANLITCIIADVIIFLTNIAVSLLLGSLLFARPNLPLRQFLTLTLLTITAETALTSFLLMLSMLISKKSLGAVAALISTLLLLMATMTVSNGLAAPEYYEAYNYVDSATGKEIQIDSQKNPHYLRGNKRKLYEFLNDLIPASQLYQVVELETEHESLMILYDGAIFLLTSAVGILIFRKKDLK